MVMGDMVMSTELLIIGNGPGGYGAAYRAADMGLDVTLVDPRPNLGGTCLFHGCIPAKTYLFLAKLIEDAKHAERMGVTFDEPIIDIKAIRNWKNQIITSIADDLTLIGEKRNIQLIKGRATFTSSTNVRLTDSEVNRITFKHAIIATGSRPIALVNAPFNAGSRIMNSSAGLDLRDIPKNLLIVGGGCVGLEIGSIYASLGSKVSLVESQNRLLSDTDHDLVLPLTRKLNRLFHEIRLNTTCIGLDEEPDCVNVTVDGNEGVKTDQFDRVLVAIGRRANSDNLDLENTTVAVDSVGNIKTNDQQRTNDKRIFAVGDVTGGAMLAHKATREGRIAAEVIGGKHSGFDTLAIPVITYTDPQIAWCGLTEERAKRENIPIRVQIFSFKHAGRAQTLGSTDGFTKLILNPDSGRILGLGVTGRDTEGLISEGVLAIEMGALAEDLALTLHPYPTLSETLGEAAEMDVGSPIHIFPQKRTRG